MNSPGNSPGWYSDPLREGRLRYFDGANWTDEVCDPPTAAHSPSTAGWYPDPLDRTRQRYFNGASWTDDLGPGTIRPANALPSQAVQPESSAVWISEPPGGAWPDPMDARRMTWLTRSPQIFVIGGVAVAAAVALGLLISLLTTPDRGVEAAGSAARSSTNLPPAAPTPRPATPEPPPEEGTGQDQIPADNVLTTQEVNSILKRVMPDWSVRSISPSPESLAVDALLSESSDSAARAGGNFMAAMIYRDSAEPRSDSEIRFLEGITDELRFNYPYQNWVPMHCGNVVILVADLGAEVIADEMPSFVSCRSL